MRLSASRIRSINRAIARVQSSAWCASRKNSRPFGPQPGASFLHERAQVREDRRRPKEQSRVGPATGTGEETCWAQRVLLAHSAEFDRVLDPGYNHTTDEGGRTPCMPSSV